MKLFDNEVGRPTNEIKKKRSIFFHKKIALNYPNVSEKILEKIAF